MWFWIYNNNCLFSSWSIRKQSKMSKTLPDNLCLEDLQPPTPRMMSEQNGHHVKRVYWRRGLVIFYILFNVNKPPVYYRNWYFNSIDFISIGCARVLWLILNWSHISDINYRKYWLWICRNSAAQKSYNLRKAFFFVNGSVFLWTSC